jgi:hypothetical protein
MSELEIASKIFGAIPTAYRFGKEMLQDARPKDKELSPKKTEADLENINEPYQVSLGRRHKILREQILQLNPREMSDFYGFEKVSFLESCEAGLDEFPTDSIRRLVETFFIQHKHIQEGKGSIFQKFDIIVSREDCLKYLSNGFTPRFLCDPNFDETGFVYLVFYKKEQEVLRMISSNTVGCLYSNGGGANNIYNFIYAMLDVRCDSYISFVNVKPEEWKHLDEGSWYERGIPFGSVGMANHKAIDIFSNWVKSARKNYEEN